MERSESEKLKAMQELTMMQSEEENIAGQFNKGLDRFASIESEDLLAFLKAVTEEIKKNKRIFPVEAIKKSLILK